MAEPGVVDVSLDDDRRLAIQQKVDEQASTIEGAQQAQLAVESCSPDKMKQHLVEARAVPSAVLASLPNLEAVDDGELKQLVRDVRGECAVYTTFITDFVRTMNSGVNHLKLLFAQVQQLAIKGSRVIENVRENHNAWNYDDIKPQVDAVDTQFEKLTTHISEVIATVQSDLASQRATKIMQLHDYVSGTNNVDVALHGELENQMREQRDQHRKVLDIKSKIQYMQAEEKRMALNLTSTEAIVTRNENELVDLKRKKAELSEKHATSYKEIIDDYAAKRAGLRTGIEAMGSDNDPLLEELRRDASKAYKECADIQARMKAEAEPTMHFVFMVDQSSEMRGANSAMLRSAIKDFAKRRNQTSNGKTDRVSFVTFGKDGKLWVNVHNWAKVLDSEGLVEDQSYRFSVKSASNFATGWRLALEVVKEVADSTQPLKTVLVLITPGSPTDEITESVDLAKKVCEAASAGNGRCMGLLLLVGRGLENELFLQPLVKAMNSGSATFTDGSGSVHKFCSHASEAHEIGDTFGRFTELTSAGANAAKLHFQCSNEKIENITALIKLQEAQQAERREKFVDNEKQKALRLDMCREDAAQDLLKNTQSLGRFLDEEIKNRGDNIQLALQVLEPKRKEQGELLKHIEELQFELGLQEKHFATKTELINGEQMTHKELYTKRKKAMTDKFGTFDVTTLVELLQYANAHMQNGQILVSGVVESFNLAAVPVANMITNLKQRNGVVINSVIGPRKVMEYYRQKGGLMLGTTGTDFKKNWKIIVAHCVPTATPQDVDMFTDFMQLEDFCYSVGDLDARGRQRKLEELVDKLNDACCRNGACEKKKRKIDSISGTYRKKKARLEDFEEKLRAASDRDEIRDLSDDVRGLETEMKEIDMDKSAAQDDLSSSLTEEYGGVLNLLRPVQAAVGNVYESVLLANGVADCEWNLTQICNLFRRTIAGYCKAQMDICTTFLEASSVTGAQESVRLCLQSATRSREETAKLLNINDAHVSGFLPLVDR
jgi:hypothetical protein